MITYIRDSPDIQAKAEVEKTIEAAYIEVRKLLPELPKDLKIWLDNRHLIPETGCGGYAYASDIMNISFDLGFKDRKAQSEHVRATIFHEGFHLVQGLTEEHPKVTPRNLLDFAIYEGCATVFEREYANSHPLWGDYHQHTSDLLERWQRGLHEIKRGEYRGDWSIHDKWAFYDEESGERWRLYKTGTWLVDEALKKSGLDIIDLRLKNADEIIHMIQ
jgi:uncharacterized protein YjaZ